MRVAILGTRGIPAKHGGFETFADDLSSYLTGRGHAVTVYCQTENQSELKEDTWRGVHRVLLPARDGALGTVLFDWAATKHSCIKERLILTLGYNTGIFNLLYRLRHIPNVMNMDGIEWKRDKWSFPQRAWLWFNEWAGARVADHLIADHPEIAAHLRRHTSPDKITTIPYGADAITSASSEPLRKYSLRPKGYYLLIARPEPENSVYEVVRAWSSRVRNKRLVVLGDYNPDLNSYHRKVLQAASTEVLFLGAVYQREVVRALRYHARAYFHGHRVGGTNPSLVEALAAGNAVIAHDNRFTRWVAGDRAKFFNTTFDLEAILDLLDAMPEELSAMEAASRVRHRQFFTQQGVLRKYEDLLLRVASRCYGNTPAREAQFEQESQAATSYVGASREQ